ncbi:DUF445 domain-containing protein [Aequorivita xiaoshiensis]|uniref:DUF445 domain-containing protein n=1 Tax=Aequorivita xiaoshiensis TaxID=2874476 RepID=A0A9X1R3S4_9FLAO|nr:DUF445 domain-containing protein [Aequorivita xiaoshiensis]MCG2431711.1 DUF445 domain-containing protein [Aequorivita xiaoshiensis]
MSDIKKNQLRKHKRLATGLFFFMAIVYGLMVYLQHQGSEAWMGYVEAFSEAGMVGALADWFAVTAIFKHPLGIPIPHTNLIERKKDDLGQNLGKFVKDNFLNPENIRPYIEKLNVVKWVSEWLNKPTSQKILEKEIINLTTKIISDLQDKDVEQFLANKGTEILREIDFQKISSSGIKYFIDKNEHITLLEILLPEIKEYINESQEMILHRLSENRPFIAFLAGRKISNEVVEGLIKFIDEIESDKEHFVRKKLTENLQGFSEDILVSEQWKEKFETLKQEVLTEQNLRTYTNDAWQSIKGLLLQNLENPNSQLQGYLQSNIQKLSHSLSDDQEISNRINSWVRHFLYRMTLKNSDEVVSLISSTVAGWEGKELSEKLELEVGKDLQFIRINGTLVGGFVGLLIYTLTHLFI